MIDTLAPTIEQSLQDLCQAIAADPEILAARENAEAFLADESAVAMYREVINLSNALEKRHRSGETISESEVSAFEELQEKADSHDLIRSFNEAQGTLQKVATMVNSYVTKTLEKGRVATAEDFPKGCGEGCGCH